MPPMYEDYTIVRNGEELAVSASYTSVRSLFESLKKLANYKTLQLIQKLKEWGGRVKSSKVLIDITLE